MNLGRFSVRNPVFINLMMLTILVLGFLSLNRLPQEQFSEVPFFWINIIVPYPGVAAEDVEKAVTVKIENEMQGLEKLKQVQSVSSEGLSVVRVEFDDGISNSEFETLFQDVRTRFSRVELPDGTLATTIDDFSSSDFLPVIEVVLTGDSEQSVLNSQAQLLQTRLAKINEVSGVGLVGDREKNIYINVEREKLASLGISINEIVRALSSQNINVPGGTLTTPSKEYLIRTVGELENVEAFNEVIIRQGASGYSPVRIKDIAKVSESYDEKGLQSRFNGEQAIVLQVTKVPRGNSVDIVKEVKEEIADYTKNLPPGLEVKLYNDSTVQIRSSLNILINNAIFGLIFLVVILYLFIGLRNALMTGLGIPITFAITFVVLELTGQTFNTNTLFGMVLVLGLIVDHAIVIIENSFRLQQTGLNRRDAAIQGTNQVVVPVIAATLTTVAAFLPLMILPGTIGKFLRVIPLTVTIALLASTFESLVFLPSHFADWPGGKKQLREKWFNAFKAKYEKMFQFLYRRKRTAVVLMTGVLILSFALVGGLKQDLFSAEDFTLFYIDLELPNGSTIDKTLEVTAEFEKKIMPKIGEGEIVSVISTVGASSSSSGETTKNNIAQIIVDLTERSEGRKRSIVQIMDETRVLCSDISGLENVTYSKATNGPPVSSPVSYRLFGDDYNQLETVSKAIQERLATYPELFNISDNLEAGSPELQLRVDPERASSYGLSVSEVGLFIRYIFDGVTATTIFKSNDVIDIVVRFSPEEADSVLDIDGLLIPTSDGRLIPFSSIADIKPGDAFSGIKRVDGKREITIESGAYTTDNVRKINAEIKRMFKDEFSVLYPEVSLKVGGEFSDFNDLLFQILRVFLLGIFLIYLILGTQFRSYLQPLLIILGVPFAFIGVIWFLFISRTPFSTTVIYACVALAGIAVNDSIVLISFINELRAEGISVREAISQATSTRLRPILLTSLTTIAGLIPTAIGIGGRSIVWGPMASTIIFGLIFSTTTALIFIPNVYGILFDKEGRNNKQKRFSLKDSL